MVYNNYEECVKEQKEREREVQEGGKMGEKLFE